MLQIDKIITAIDKLKSPFSVVDVMTMARIERTTSNQKIVSSEMSHLVKKGVLGLHGKELRYNLFYVPQGKTAAELRKESWRKPGWPEGSQQIEKVVLPEKSDNFRLGEVRMVAAKERYFSA